MERRRFIKLSSYGTLLYLAARHLPSFAQDFKMEEIRNGIGYFTESGGTIGWFGSPEGWVVIDTQFPHSAGHLIEALKSRDQTFKYLINTHHHGDHTSGNILFKDLVSEAYAHENALKNLKTITQDDSKMFYPTQTFSGEQKLQLGDETLELIYQGRGHTDGDAIVHFKQANIVHMGDLVFNRRFPYIDKSAGAHIGSWIQVLEKTKARFDKDTVYIFGHAGENYPVTGTAEDLTAFQHYLQQLLDYVTQGKKNGKTLEQLLQTTEIPGAPEWKGEGIERSINAAWQEV